MLGARNQNADVAIFSVCMNSGRRARNTARRNAMASPARSWILKLIMHESRPYAEVHKSDGVRKIERGSALGLVRYPTDIIVRPPQRHSRSPSPRAPHLFADHLSSSLFSFPLFGVHV